MRPSATTNASEPRCACPVHKRKYGRQLLNPTDSHSTRILDTWLSPVPCARAAACAACMPLYASVARHHAHLRAPTTMHALVPTVRALVGPPTVRHHVSLLAPSCVHTSAHVRSCMLPCAYKPHHVPKCNTMHPHVCYRALPQAPTCFAAAHCSSPRAPMYSTARVYECLRAPPCATTRSYIFHCAPTSVLVRSQRAYMRCCAPLCALHALWCAHRMCPRAPLCTTVRHRLPSRATMRALLLLIKRLSARTPFCSRAHKRVLKKKKTCYKKVLLR